MDNLIKIIFIKYSSYCFVLKLKYVFVGNSLQLLCEYYQILNTDIINIVEQSLKDNPENEQVLNTISMNMAFSVLLSQDRALTTYYKLTASLKQLPEEDINKPHLVSIDTLNLYLNIIQINLVLSFLSPFCKNYEEFKINLKLAYTKNLKANETPTISSQNEVKQIINQPTAESINIKPADYIENILMSFTSNRLINSFIVKHLNGNPLLYVKEDIPNDSLSIKIQIPPLINLSYLGYNFLMYTQLKDLIGTVGDDNKSIIIKLSICCKEILSIITDESLSAEEKSLSLQILTFLVFLYSLKFNINVEDFPSNLLVKYPSIINQQLKNYIHMIRKDSSLSQEELDKLKYIFFEFVDNDESDSIIRTEKLNLTVQKYKYLLLIDRDVFLNSIFGDLDQKSPDNKPNVKFLIGTPKIININNFMDLENQNIEFLNYKTIIFDKYAKTHKIISEPYLQLLHIHYQNPMVMLSQIKIHPVISKYSDILLKNIYTDLYKTKSEMLKYTFSTLVILNEFIRPYIKEEPPQIEMFLIYQVLIPMIYDIDNSKTEFLDYFLALPDCGI